MAGKEKIAIQGEFGSFSHEAALAMVPEAEVVPCAYSVDVFDKIAHEGADAVIPIENSLAGSVVEHYDLLFSRDVRILSEYLLRIRHNLIGAPGSALDRVRHVYSHPVALAQCRRFLERHPAMRALSAYDTAGSVKKVMAEGDGSAAAIASRQAAAYYGAALLAEDIEDNSANFTRFIRISGDRAGAPLKDRAGSADKISIAFIVENRPGSLVSALEVFRDYSANLSKIESRPVHGQPWDYVFYADCRMTAAIEIDAMLDALRRRCLVVKELGRYWAATG